MPPIPSDDTSKAQRSDAALLRGTADDPEQFGQFYDRHVETILSYFMARTTCAHTAADLTSETFASALVNVHQYKEKKGTPRQWLYGIARNQLNRSLKRGYATDRAMNRIGMRPVEVDSESLERIESLLDTNKHVNALRQALTGLPAGIMEAVMLRVGQDLAFTEVAERLDISEGAARVRVSRGLAALHDALSVEA